MYSNFLRPSILKPTRIVANNRPSVIDSIFIKTIDKKIGSGNIIDKGSDHPPDFLLDKDFIETKNIKNNNKRFEKLQ